MRNFDDEVNADMVGIIRRLTDAAGYDATPFLDDAVRSLIADRDAARNEAANLRVKLSAHDREVRARALEEAADAMHAEADSRPLGDAAPDGPLAGASTYNILRHGERFLRARAAAERSGKG